MSNYESAFAIRTFAANASSFTDVQGLAYLPMNCSTIVVLNETGVDVYLRSDPNNANSQVTIHTGQQFEIGAAPNGATSFRFPQGCPAPCSLKSSSGTVNLIIESIT